MIARAAVAKANHNGVAVTERKETQLRLSLRRWLGAERGVCMARASRWC